MAKKIIPPIHLACSVDDNRISQQYIKIEKGIAYATEGHIMVLVNLKHHSDLAEEVINALDGKYVHMDTWKKIMDAELITLEDNEIVYLYGLTKAKFEIAEDINFPNVKDVLNPILNSDNKSTDRIAFRPKFTDVFNKIFNSGELHFIFKEHSNAILVYPCVGAYQYGLIMPIAENEPYEFEFDISS